MWGNIGNFSDLAKAAQELQEQAASSIKQAPTFSPPFGGVTGGLFNLDALQQNTTQAPHAATTKAPESPPKSPQVVVKTPIKSLQSLPIPAVPVAKPPTNVKGKLKIPQPTNVQVSAVVQPSMFTTPLPPPKETHALSDREKVIPLGPLESHPISSTLLQVPPIEQVPEENKEKAEESPVAVVEKLVEDRPVVPEEMSGDQDFMAQQQLPVVSENTSPDETPLISLKDDAIPAKPQDDISVTVDPPAVTTESNLSPTHVNDTEETSGEPDVSSSHVQHVVNHEPVPEPVPTPETSSMASSPPVPGQMHSHNEDQNGQGKLTTTATTTTTTTSIIPHDLMEQFSSQLQRLEENHQMEQQAMQQQHQQQVNTLMNEIQSLKEEFAKLHAEKKRQKEALTLQLDSLKHELEGTQQMLQEKAKEERKMQDAHLKELRKMEKEVNQKEAGTETLRQQLKDKEKHLEEIQQELQESRDEYATLKERVKAVAGELKDRRLECRTLQSEVSVLKESNHALQDKITHLEAQGMDMNKSSQEISSELNTLRAQLMDKDKELQEAKDAIALETKKGDEALAAYKKKAQQSLSVSNSRTASAVHAKEEAEMEARAARATADSAMERAMAAERKGNEALAEAKAYVQEMEEKVAKLNQIQSQLDEATTQLGRVRLDASTAQEASEKLTCELQSIQGRYEAEKITNAALRKDLVEATSRSGELLEEVERLRREGQRLREDLTRLATERKEVDTGATGNKNGGPTAELVPARRTAEAEETIAMLKRELQDANQAIRELKETLKATVVEQGQEQSHPVHNGNSHDSTGSIPLFYAMEKQAELSQARNEIARLANLLGDAEASKQEALDAMDDMRHQLDELQAKLELQSRRSTPQEERVNLEYLKNVILSFLNAKSHLEKKTLLPVIGTVLCLTPQEQQQAMQQLESEGKLSLDSMMNLRWK